MYDNIFSVITIKEKQRALKMRRPWLIYLGLAILSILTTSQITGVGEGDHTDLQYCLKSDILIWGVLRVYQGGQEEPNTR